MTIQVNTIDNSAKSVDLHCSVTEYLLINKAIWEFVRNKHTDITDKAIATSILGTETMFKGESE